MLALWPKNLPRLRREFAKIYINKCITPKNKKQEKLENYTKVAVLMHNAKTLIFSVGKLAPQCVKRDSRKLFQGDIAFIGNWAKTFVPILEDDTKGKMEQYTEYSVKKKMKKLTERYVLMYCSEGK